jgi:hypothetical protein
VLTSPDIITETIDVEAAIGTTRAPTPTGCLRIRWRSGRRAEEVFILRAAALALIEAIEGHWEKPTRPTEVPFLPASSQPVRFRAAHEDPPPRCGGTDISGVADAGGAHRSGPHPGRRGQRHEQRDYEDHFAATPDEVTVGGNGRVQTARIGYRGGSWHVTILAPLH